MRFALGQELIAAQGIFLHAPASWPQGHDHERPKSTRARSKRPRNSEIEHFDDEIGHIHQVCSFQFS